jgi:hypothetical protein
MNEILSILGRNFSLKLIADPARGGVHWILAEPGKRLLSGDAPSPEAARRSAEETGRTLLELEAA